MIDLAKSMAVIIIMLTSNGTMKVEYILDKTNQDQPLK